MNMSFSKKGSSITISNRLRFRLFFEYSKKKLHITRSKISRFPGKIN